MQDPSSLSDKVVKWVSGIYRKHTGAVPLAVLGVDMKSPGKSNSFLFDPLLDQFEGRISLDSGVTLGFFIYNGDSGPVFETFQPS